MIGLAFSTAVVLALASAAESAPTELKARVVSWDVGFKPAREEQWIARVAEEVAVASADMVDIVVFSELFAWGLAPYAPEGERPAEFVTRRMRDAVLPAVSAAARRDMLVALGTYPHQEPGWKEAFNRAAVLEDGRWHFADKLDPTQVELTENPPIKPGSVLPLLSFRGANAAVVVCFSLEKPEIAAALKRAGVLLVLGPSAVEDDDGIGRVLRSASARAVELGAAVLVAPLLGRQDDWINVGSAALFLPAQKGIDAQTQVRERWESGIHRDDFSIPWSALQGLRHQPENKPEPRPFLAPTPAFSVEAPQL